MHRKISAHANGGTSEPSSVRRRGARTPIGVSGNLFEFFISFLDIIYELLRSTRFQIVSFHLEAGPLSLVPDEVVIENGGE